ncbi:MAG: HAD hydrolase family protein [Bacteroidetes bacterium]|nr:HAD hydrolase family protein [Bacteroidota bacterium]MCZ2133779.1 HAD hydrolase family protein [Bacteroidota bacterium]
MPLQDDEKKNLHDKLRHIEAVVMDVDGTMTDGAMYFGANGEVMKRFSVRDGMGITLLQRAGIRTAIVTSENSPIVISRAAKLKIERVVLGSRNKKRAIIELSEQLGTILGNIAYIGDDVNDADPMRLCGVSACPSDAVATIRDIADFICTSEGGKGAVREFAEAILIAQGKSITLPESW